MGDLLDWHHQKQLERDSPLAARMRPLSLDDFVGQEHIVGPGRLLRRAIEADRLSSLLFFGPPGTGKTTLASIVARTTKAHFIAINAVLAGVKDLRAAIKDARERLRNWNQRTILFIDEVHRFNKAQQDALLPWVENGTVTLIGATTENPYFEVNKALVSRSRVFQLKPLTESALHDLLQRTLDDPARGYGTRAIQLTSDAANHLVNVANGDARVLLSALELAVETTPAGPDGVIKLSLAIAEESIQQRAVLYDKEGDAHFDTISAFIKSIRGSDPDAALYWLARMVYAGENPRFIFRRLLILASEDVGLADPHAINVVDACASAFDRVGMPEGRFHLAHATLFLANAPKSNSVMGFFDALAAIKQEREREVPNHLRDPARDKHGFGHGQGYLYPHAYKNHWLAQQYLPAALQGRVFFQPTQQGFEATIHDQVSRRRDAQLTAMLEGHTLAPPEILTNSPDDPEASRWLQRTLNASGERLAHIRQALFDKAKLQRHHVVLDVNASTGLLTWEAVRLTPEGHLFACTFTPEHNELLTSQAQALDPLRRPEIFTADLDTLPSNLLSRSPDLSLDRIIGRNALAYSDNLCGDARTLAELCGPETQLLFAESLPRYTQRICALVPEHLLEPDLFKRWQDAEELIYTNATQPRHQWKLDDLIAAFNAAGFDTDGELLSLSNNVQVTPALVDRWFQAHDNSYVSHLKPHLSGDELSLIRAQLSAHLVKQRLRVSWRSAVALISARRVPACDNQHSPDNS